VAGFFFNPNPGAVARALARAVAVLAALLTIVTIQTIPTVLIPLWNSFGTDGNFELQPGTASRWITAYFN
jgi:hypothetical protein